MATHQDIDALLEGDVAISARWISNAYSVNISEAQKMLLDYSQAYSSIHSSFIISGIRKSDNVYKFKHVRSQELPRAQDEFKTPIEATIYSVSNIETESISAHLVSMDTDQIKSLLLSDDHRALLNEFGRISLSSTILLPVGKRLKSAADFNSSSANKGCHEPANSSNFPKPLSAKSSQAVIKTPSATVSNFFNQPQPSSSHESTPAIATATYTSSSSTTKKDTLATAVYSAAKLKSDAKKIVKLFHTENSQNSQNDVFDRSQVEEDGTSATIKKADDADDETWDDGTGYATNKALLKEREREEEEKLRMRYTLKNNDEANEDDDEDNKIDVVDKRKPEKKKKRTVTPVAATFEETDSGAADASIPVKSHDPRPAHLQRGAMDDYFEDLAVAAELQRLDNEKNGVAPAEPVKKKKKKLVEKVRKCVK